MIRKVGDFYGFNWHSLDYFCFFAKSKNNEMNKYKKAIAVIMIIVAAIIVAGCNKPDEPNNGGGNNNGSGNNDSDVRVTTYTPQDITGTTAKCGGDVIVTQGLSINGLGEILV